MEAKWQYYLLKLTMLSGRSTVVGAEDYWRADNVLAMCHRRLSLDGGARMEAQLWHGPEMVPADARVRDWPGVQPKGEISEYQLLLRR
eukprot:714487-Amphidinium_carterae.1